MPKSTSHPKKVPVYRQRAGYAQALVTLTDSITKRRRDYSLGPFGSPASRERYHRLIAEWEARDRRLPIDRRSAHPTDVTESITFNEVALEYWRYVG